MSPVDNIERRLEQLHVTTKAETDKRILGDAFAALHKGLQRQEAGIWRLIVTSRMSRPLAAAAVILITLALFLGRPAGGSDTVGEFYKTLGGARNFCVSTFEAGQTSPNQQVWTSQNLKVRLFKAGRGDQAQLALWDAGEQVHMIRYLSNVETKPLTEEELAELEKSVTLPSEVAPFAHVRDVPERARWSRVNDPAVESVSPGCVVYDLMWVQPGTVSGTSNYRMWRVFVNAKTHLPRRAESYVKSKPEEEYTLKSFVNVTYPSESEIEDIVASTFGPPGSRTGGPAHLGTPGIER